MSSETKCSNSTTNLKLQLNVTMSLTRPVIEEAKVEIAQARREDQGKEAEAGAKIAMMAQATEEEAMRTMKRRRKNHKTDIIGNQDAEETE